MDIQQIINFVIENKVVIIEAYLALIGFASIIIKLTPTVKDDNFFKKYLKFTGKYLALNRK